MAENALQNLMRNRQTIKKLMAMDSNGQMDKLYENAKATGRISEGQDGVSYKPAQRMLNEEEDRVVVNEEVMKNSKLPISVLESFKKNPGSSMKMPASVLDGLGLESLQEMRNEVLEEQTVQPQQGGAIVDYSLLKTIINEAVQENVKKYVSAMTKKLMTEGINNNSTVQAVKIGDKFSFITENGDIYEATLKFKTNLNEQTKKKKN